MSFVHTLDVAFNVRSEHEDWMNVSLAEAIAALQARLDYIKSRPEEWADAIGHVDTQEEPV